MRKIQWLLLMFLLSVVLFGCTSESGGKTESDEETVSTSSPTNEKEDETSNSESTSNQEQKDSSISNKPLEVHFIDVGQGDSIIGTISSSYSFSFSSAASPLTTKSISIIDSKSC